MRRVWKEEGGRLEKRLVCWFFIALLSFVYVQIVDGETALIKGSFALPPAPLGSVPLQSGSAPLPSGAAALEKSLATTEASSSSAASAPDAPTAEPFSRALRIAVFLWRGETDAERSFYQKLRELGYRVSYDVFDVHQSLKEVFQILDHQFDAKQYQYVYAFGSQLALILKRHLRNEVPLLFNAVSFPEESGLVVGLRQTRENASGFTASMLNITGGNTSGIRVVSDVRVQLEYVRTLFPFERLCVWINPQDLGSVESLKQLEGLAAEFQFQVFGYRIPNEDALWNAARLLGEGHFPIKCDAIWIPSASLFVKNAKALGKMFRKAQVPAITEALAVVEEGALIAVAPDHSQTGIRLAEMLDQHRRGRDLQFIPVKYPEPQVCINKNALRQFALSIADKPKDFLKRVHYVQTSLPEAEPESPAGVPVDITLFSEQNG